MSSDKNIIYDENRGVFTIKNKSLFGLLGFFGIGNSHQFEKYMSIKNINNFKEKANLTTLGNTDINLLYNFAQKEFNYDKNKNEFISTPIKNIFKNLSDDKLAVNKLMMISYDYFKDSKNGNKPIIEKFSVGYRINNTIKLFILLFILCLIVILIFSVIKVVKPIKG